MVVCANKVDANHGNLENLVDETEARLWAELHGFPYCETSACTGQGVGDMFQVQNRYVTKEVLVILTKEWLFDPFSTRN